MTPKQERSFARWAASIAHTLVPGWDIRLHFGPPDSAADGSGAIAAVTCIWGRKIAHVTVSPEIAASSPEEQRHVIVHEFVHIPLFGVKELVRVSLAEKIGTIAWEAFEPGLTNVDEHATDALASAIEDFFPLWIP